MARIVWTDAALRHLREIVEFVARRSPTRAEELSNRLMEAAERLELLPLIGRVVPEFKREDFRELIVRPYRLLYRVRDDTCFIVGVVHSSRDFPRFVRDEDLLEE